MPPLGYVALGLAIVVLDFRAQSLDFLLDPAGWGLVALGAHRIALPATMWLAVVTAGLSVGDVLLPSRWAVLDLVTGEELPPEVGEGLGYAEDLRFDDVSGWRLALMTLAMVGAGLVLWTLLGALAARARGRDPRAARRMAWARVAVLAVWVVPYLVVVGVALVAGDGQFDPVWNAPAEYLALASLVAVGWVILLLAQGAESRWGLRPAGDRRG